MQTVFSDHLLTAQHHANHFTCYLLSHLHPLKKKNPCESTINSILQTRKLRPQRITFPDHGYRTRGKEAGIQPRYLPNPTIPGPGPCQYHRLNKVPAGSLANLVPSQVAMETQDLQTQPFRQGLAHSDASQLKLNMASIGGREVVPLGRKGRAR